MMFFFFNDTATTEIYTLSLHDALPICVVTAAADDPTRGRGHVARNVVPGRRVPEEGGTRDGADRSEEHTSELQSRQYLVCRLLLEKKKLIHSVTIQILTVPCSSLYFS